MRNFYKVFYGEVESGVAYTDDAGLFTLPYDGLITNWKLMKLELRQDVFADYLASDAGCRLCSERLRAVLQKHASSEDELQWLPAEVRRRAEVRSYFVLHFPHPFQVLDMDASIRVRDFVVKPVLSSRHVGSHEVFAYPQAGILKLFIGESVKKEIELLGYTGMEFSRAAIR